MAKAPRTFGERPSSSYDFTLQLLITTLLFAAFLAYLRWPVFNLFSTHLLGGIGGDTNLYFWLVSTFPHNLIERGWFETNSFYPYKETLAWSDNFLFPSCFFYLLKKVAGLGEIVSWNIVILLAQFLNGISVFLLARRFAATFSSSLVLGSLFIASSYFAEHLGHPQLQFFFFIPFGINIFLALLEKPNAYRSTLFAIIITLTFLSTVYYAIALVLICALYFCLNLLAKNFPSKKLWSYLIFSAFLTTIILLPFLLPYFRVKDLFGARGLHEFYYFGISALSFLCAAPISNLYGHTNTFSQGEAHFGWGLITLALLALGSYRIWKISPKALICVLFALILAEQNFSIIFELNRTLRLYSAAAFSWLAIICFAVQFLRTIEKPIYLYLAGLALIISQIALGPLGYPEIGVHAFGPFTFFYKLFPGLDSLRAISRLGSVVILLLSLAAIPFLNSFGKKVLLLIPLLIFESRVTSFPLAPLPPTPKIFAEIPKLISSDTAFLIAPLSGKLDKNNQIISWSEVAEINSRYLVSLRDSAPLLMNGYSGQRPKTIFDLPRIMQRFPSEAALEKLLKFEKLRYVVVLGSEIKEFSEDVFLAGLLTLGEQRVKIVVRDGMDFIVEIQR